MTSEFEELRQAHDEAFEGLPYAMQALELGFEPDEEKARERDKPLPEGHDELAGFLYIGLMAATMIPTTINQMAHSLALALEVSDIEL